MATTSRPTIIGESNQSSSWPLSSMICSEPTQMISRPEADEVDRQALGRISCSGRVRRASATSSTATGTLMKNTHDQPKVSEM